MMELRKCEESQEELHKNILTDLCLKLKNCADCYNEETRETDCHPLHCLYMELHNVTADTFFLEPYDSKTHIDFAEIASKHGYEMTFICENDQKMIKFYKKR